MRKTGQLKAFRAVFTPKPIKVAEKIHKDVGVERKRGRFDYTSSVPFAPPLGPLW